jgi:cell fate regulator YaaT (PSP1 superfamily)
MMDVDKETIKINWEKYSSAFNELSDKMNDAGLDVKLLRKVVDSYEEYLTINQSFYQSKD